MAAPVKNLVDATAPSFFPPKTIPLTPTFRTLDRFCLIPAMQINLVTDIPRFTLVEVSKNTFTQVPLFLAGIKQKQAGEAAIKTFPAIYKERVSERPTEGQIFPRGYK